jgi:hypothetical protein
MISGDGLGLLSRAPERSLPSLAPASNEWDDTFSARISHRWTHRRQIDAGRPLPVEHDEERKQLATGRAGAIRAALDAGSTLERLANLMGFTEGRVRQMDRSNPSKEG